MKMDRIRIREQLQQDQATAIVQAFQQQGYPLTEEAIAQDIRTSGLSAIEIFDLFQEVLSFTSNSKQDVPEDRLQQVRDALKRSLPTDVVDHSDFFQAIPHHLEAHQVEPGAFFETLWQALRDADRDEATIAVGWGAFLYLDA
jgi:hypothetical protein